MTTSYDAPRRTRPGLGRGLVAMIGLLVVMWVLELVDQATRNSLDPLGIEPLSTESLDNVLWAPWLHGSFAHLASNSLPFLVLGALVVMDGWRRWLVTTLVVVVASGAAVWFLSPPGSITLGASGVVFGWMTYVMLRGFWTRSPGQIATGVVLFLFYGGMLWGVLPSAPGISWQAHLGGAVGGVVAASLARPSRASASSW
nr:rhomboid family intramembrane serine protease [Nocardioides aequoreus]